MSSHCSRYPNCGCNKNCGSKCHLPVDHPDLKKKEPDVIVIGHVGHGMSMHIHDILSKQGEVLLINPEEARDLPTLPYKAPLPLTPIPEPVIISDFFKPANNRYERRKQQRKNKKNGGIK